MDIGEKITDRLISIVKIAKAAQLLVACLAIIFMPQNANAAEARFGIAVVSDDNSLAKYAESLFVLFSYFDDSKNFLKSPKNANVIVISNKELIGDDGFLNAELLKKHELTETWGSDKFNRADTCRVQLTQTNDEVPSIVYWLFNNRKSVVAEKPDFSCVTFFISSIFGLSVNEMSGLNPSELISETLKKIRDSDG